MKRAFVVAIGLVVAPTVLFGQQQESRTGFVVTQLQICAAENQAEINRFTDEIVAPIIEELRAEGMIRSWSHLVHAWGDEWNNVNITVADSHAAFLTYWAEFVQRLNARAPNWQEEFLPLCSLHKDNMYSMRNSR